MRWRALYNSCRKGVEPFDCFLGGMTTFFLPQAEAAMTRSSASKALSANKVSACIWGRSNVGTLQIMGLPRVRKKASGLPRASTMAWILVLNPPLLRPMAWSSPSFFEPGAVLMCAYDGAVDHRVFVVRASAASISRSSSMRRSWPSAKTGVNLDRVTKTFRQVSPGNASAVR